MARPPRPEPKFFLRQDAVDLGYAGYRIQHFSHWHDQPVLGEKSTSYIERADCIARIRAVLPDASLIFVLRNPIQRAYSNWRFSSEQGIETLSFEAALAAEPTRIASWNGGGVSVCPFAYVARGYYARYLELWERHFPSDQIIVTTNEMLFAGGSALSELFARMGLDITEINIETEPANMSEDEEDGYPNDAVARALRDCYDDDIRSLQERWGLDINAWLSNQ